MAADRLVSDGLALDRGHLTPSRGRHAAQTAGGICARPPAAVRRQGANAYFPADAGVGFGFAGAFPESGAKRAVTTQ